MKKTFLLLCLAACLAGQSGTGGKSSKPRPGPASDPEARWICRIGSYHECHCPMQVHEEEDKILAACEKSGKPAAECVAMVDPCKIILTADAAHPTHSCKRTCSKPRCSCHDGPRCGGPELYDHNAVPYEHY